MASFLAIDGYAEMDLPAPSAAVKGAIEAKLSASAEGGLTIKYDLPKCEVDLEVTAKAAAECDVEADSGQHRGEVRGSCEVLGGRGSGVLGDGHAGVRRHGAELRVLG
ncbi:MAG: hypothetical protein U0168_09735 [Nannocystaceae bacterium]